MPLPVYDAQDAVPEDQRDEYVEHEGKWHPKAVVELTKEKAKRAALLSEKKEAERLRTEAEKERDALKQAREAGEKGVSEEALQKIRDDEAKARKPIEEDRDRLAAENRKLKLTDQVQALYLANGGMKDRVKTAMKELADRADLGDAGGIVYKDADGNITADSAEQFFKKFFVEFPFFKQGTGSSGSGAEGSNGGGGSPPSKDALDQERRRHAERVSSAL